MKLQSKNCNHGPSKNLSNNFEHDEELSHEENIEKGEEIIRQLKQAASEIAGKLEDSILDYRHVERSLNQLYWECEVYQIECRKGDIRSCLKVIDEHHQNELQQKELLHEVNQLCHKLQHGRNTCAEERKIQKSMKYVATKRNEKLCTNSATEIESRIPYYLMEIVRSKESIKDIEQGLYNELHQQGDPKQIYRKKSRHLKKKSEALEKEICALEQKLDKINSRRRKVVTYMSQLKTSLAKF